MIEKGITYLIRLYQKLLSPIVGQECRFFPTCSDYCLEAIHNYGLLKGLYKGALRILRCNPLCKGGYDPAQKLIQAQSKEDLHES